MVIEQIANFLEQFPYVTGAGFTFFLFCPIFLIAHQGNVISNIIFFKAFITFKFDKIDKIKKTCWFKIFMLFFQKFLCIIFSQKSIAVEATVFYLKVDQSQRKNLCQSVVNLLGKSPLGQLDVAGLTIQSLGRSK